MKREFATAAIKVANSIEAHLTGAVATISQRNQAIAEAVGQAIIQVIGQHFRPVVSVFSFSVFKAKAFRFCHFFCPLLRLDRAGYVTPDLIGGLASFRD